MKLTIDRANLLGPLGHASGVVERRNLSPILSNLLLRCDDNSLTMIATDMDMDIVESVAATIAAPGVATVPAHLMYDIARKLPDGAEIELALGDDGQVSMRAGRSSFSLPTMPAEDFPAISDEAMTTEFTLAAGDFAMLIENTRFAVSTEETRYYLNGIFLHPADKKHLRAVSTDGHRLARSQIALPGGADGMPPAIIPRKTVGELGKLIDEYEGDIKIGVTDARARFTFGNVEITTKLIDGTFPDYQRVIPTDNENILRVNAAEFRRAVDRVSTVSADKTRSIKMRIASSALTLSASSTDSASGEETLEAEYEGSDIEIGYNAGYLLEVAQQVDGETIEFALADSALPTVIKSPGDEANLFVLMPMRV